MKKVLSFLWKTLKWALIALIFLIALVFLVAKVPSVQKFIIGYGIQYFNDTTDGELAIDDLALNLPFHAGLRGVSLKNPTGVEILYVDALDIHIGWRYALKQVLRVDRVSLKGMRAEVIFDAEGNPNYGFVVDGFAQSDEEPVEADTSGGGWDISVGRLVLEDIQAVYADRSKGDSIHLNLGSLRVDMDRFSLEDQTFLASEITLKNTSGFAQLNTPEAETESETEPETAPTESGMTLGLDKLQLEGNRFTYVQAGTANRYAAEIGILELEMDGLDLDAMTYEIESLKWSDTRVNLTMEPSEPDTTSSQGSLFLPLHLRLDDLDFSRIELRMQTAGQPENDLDLALQTLRIKDLIATPDKYGLNIEALNADYGELDRLEEFRTGLSLTATEAKIEDLVARYGTSLLEMNALWQYADPTVLTQGAFAGEAQLNIPALLLTPADIAHFADVFAIPDTAMAIPNSPLELNATLHANAQTGARSQIDLALGNTRLTLDAEAEGKDLNPESYRLDRLNLDLDRRDVLPFLHLAGMDTAMIPPDVNLALSGFLGPAGSHLEGHLNTAYGDIEIRGEGNPQKHPTTPKHGRGTAARPSHNQSPPLPLTVELQSPGFQFHRALGSPDTLESDFRIALDIEDIMDTVDLRADFHLRIDTLRFGGDKLREIDLKGQYSKDSTTALFSVADTFLLAELNLRAFTGEALEAQVDGFIEGVDFQGLGLSPDDLRGRFGVFAEYFAEGEVQSGRVTMDEILFVRGAERFDLTALDGRFLFCPDSSFFKLSSPFADLTSVSNRSVEDLGLAMGNMLGSGKTFSPDSAVWWRADFISKDAETLRDLFLPELQTFEPATATVRFHSGEELFSAQLNFPKIQYANIVVDSLVFAANVVEAGVEAGLFLNRVAMDSLALDDLSFQTLNTAEGTRMILEIGEEDWERHYHIEAEMKSQRGLERGFDIQMADSILLNGKAWNVNPENAFRVDDEGIELKHLGIHRNGRTMGFSKDPAEASVRVMAERFPLSALSGMVGTDEELFKGELFGEFIVNQNGTFDGAGRIEAFELSKANLGDLTWKAEKQEGLYRVQISTDGEDLSFEISGDIVPETTDAPQLQLDFVLNKLALGALPSLVPTIVEAGEGTLVGQFEIGGTTAAPSISGYIAFEDSKIKMAGNGSTYDIGNERITMDPERIDLNRFSLRDSSGQTLVLDGQISHERFDNMEADLTVNGKDFELMNLSKGANDLLYGSLVTDLDIRVTGRLDGPDVEADIRVSPQTDLTFVVPESDYDESFDETLVEWTNFQLPDSAQSILTRDKDESTEAVNIFTNTVRVNGTLNLDPEAEFKVLVDTLAGDYLMIRGGGDLGISYDRQGHMRINGSYEVSEGFYQMTFYNLVKRKFSFQEGSRLTWNGAPTDADIDITALYETRATVANLLAAGGGMQESDAVNARLPFEVHMNITGQLMDPEIAFDIQLADEAKGALGGAVEAQLSRLRRNESDMNKQVFALLVLNSFLGDAGSNDNFIAGQARNSASQILSQQLNRLSDQWITGVDMNFDLQSYGGAAGEGNTDLSVELAKSFADDRVIVRVGSTIALEDNTTGGQQSQEVMTNLVVEYKITPDGRYRFKVFRENNLEDIVVGRVTRTGAGVLFQRDFNRLERMFRKDPEEAQPENPEAEEEPGDAEGEEEEEEEESPADDADPTEGNESEE